jgi:hypothetical protein
MVVEHRFDEYWKSRVVGWYRYNGIWFNFINLSLLFL